MPDELKVIIGLMIIMIVVVITINTVIDYINNRPHFLYYLKNGYKYNKEHDKAIKLCIAKYREKLVSATIDRYKIYFSDGTSIWISNKFYAYGHFTNYLGNNQESKYKMSISTFKELYNLELELSRMNSFNKPKYY